MKSSEYPANEGGGLLIRDMAQDDRPREKALRMGIKSLTDTELMAILFSTGIKGKSVVQLSTEILADNDYHLSKISRMSIPDFLKRYKGIGPAKAIALYAALELGSRSAADAATLESPVVTNAQTAVKLMRRHLNNLPYEEMWVMLLSQAGRVIKEVNVGRGGVSSTIGDVRIILKHAIENLASAFILFHNHPSGTLRPSRQDDELTRKVAESAKLMDIHMNDHIIITDSGFYSYHDQGNIL